MMILNQFKQDGEINCIFCNGLLKQTHIDGVYIYFKCDKCDMKFARHKHIPEWMYIENKSWKKNYGSWVVCTREIEASAKERVVFT